MAKVAEETTAKRDAALQEVRKDLFEKAKKVAKTEGYDVLLDKSRRGPSQNPVLLHTTLPDLTDKIEDAFRK